MRIKMKEIQGYNNLVYVVVQKMIIENEYFLVNMPYF